MHHVLFICGKARMRSPTAADIVAAWDGFKADFAGLSNDADELLSSEQLAWADTVVVMEPRQRRILQSRFGAHLRGVRLVVLDVPDRYAYMEPALVDLVTARLQRVLLR